MFCLSQPRDKFIDLITDINKKKGLGSLPSKLIAEMYIEPGKLSIDDLIERTGYSRSAISSEMKNLTRGGLVKRTKEPGSKKVYFYMEKSLIDKFVNNFKENYVNIVNMLEKEIPLIIAEYEDIDSEKAEKEKKILENYYEEMQSIKEVLDDFFLRLEKIKEKR